MPRPLKGSMVCKGSSWIASVPRIKGSRQRVSSSFPGNQKSQAKAWIATQIERLNAGLEAEPAPPQGRIDSTPAVVAPATTPPVSATRHLATDAFAFGDGPDFKTVADAMVQERYVMLRSGQAARADAVARMIELHLEPAFCGPIPLEPMEGRQRVVDWVVASAGRSLSGSSFATPTKPVARGTMEERLRVLGLVLDYARLLDPRVVNFAKGIPAQEPVGADRPATRLLGIDETAQLAAEMNVIHQFVLWTLRILGPRISEPYGLLVEDFIDGGDEAALLVRAQGGREFKIWGDQPGEVISTNHLEEGKTDWAFRLVGVPRQLAVLFRLIIAAFHTDPTTGEVDLDARLIPTLRSADGGQAGFRSALKTAGTRSGVVADGERLIPHDLRKTLCVDFAWDSSLDELLKRRWVGHRAGSDVFALVYTLDRRLLDDLRPAVRSLEAQIDAQVPSGLLVPTTRRPLYDRERNADSAYTDAVLEEAGWQVRALGAEWISTEEAATILGGSPTATRRLFPERIAAIKHENLWMAKRDDVVAYRDRLAGWCSIEDIAERTGRDYHQVHRTLARLKIAGTADDQTRQLLFTEHQADVVIAEFARVDALHERAVPVAVAAKMLRASQSSIRQWADGGKRLAFDDESDGSRQYVTRASIDAELARRNISPKQVVTAEELREYAGLETASIKALVSQGHLVRVRTGTYTIESVRQWATGFRPDLLGTGLLPPI